MVIVVVVLGLWYLLKEKFAGIRERAVLLKSIQHGQHHDNQYRHQHLS
jgi:hypothetical protein